MAYSYVIYDGDGSSNIFTVPFQYLDRSHVHVSNNGVEVPYSFLTDYTISLSPAPTGTVVIRRTTPKDTTPVNFSDGSVLREAELDLLASYSLFCAQEAEDLAQEAIAQSSLGISLARVYQGSLSSNPTVRSNGGALEVGDLYFNNVFLTMRVFTGLLWQDIGITVPGILNKPLTPVIATAGQTVVPIPGGYSPLGIVVFLNGLAVPPNDITTTSGTNVVFGSPLAASDEVTWLAFGVFQVANTYTKDELASDGAVSFIGGAVRKEPVVIGFDASLVPNGSSIVFSGRGSDGDGGGGVFVYDKTGTQTVDGGIVFAPTGGGRLLRQGYTVFGFNGDVRLRWFGAKGDNATNDTAAILLAKTYAIAAKPVTILVDKGTYQFTDIGNWAYSGISLKGVSHRECVFKCTTAAPALQVDAFKPGHTGNDATAPFVQQFNVENMTFEGNSTTPIIVDLQGIARSSWKNVFVRNARTADGIGFQMRGCMLSTWERLGCSTDMDAMTSKPYEGLRLDVGSRNSINIGNSSNNVFINMYMEGLSVGLRITAGDQNMFLGGSSETNSVYDVIVGVASRYNALIGVGFESPNSTANVADAGIQTKYLNCYANKKTILQGRSCTIDGGYHHKVEVQAGASHNTVINVTLNHWNSLYPGTGGFSNAGTATVYEHLYDSITAQFIYPVNDRLGISVGASPFVWTNTTGSYVEVAIQSGTLSQVRQVRGSDSFLRGIATPGVHLLPPGEQLEVTYSVAPSMSYIPHTPL